MPAGGAAWLSDIATAIMTSMFTATNVGGRARRLL
ncbi:hypothetical protein FB558_3812 [Pseudonocardia kunmingensis]|uniref:Uncharacterized protein n=1 Tax=Pseudonocardia kunmingensis TaxID=630975 RepID=A0A543DPM0_9PSEU|nr:hypothetical protein FB558_3812 [Pseudonocardia kunmingensis]